MVAARFDRPFVAVFPEQVRELGSMEAAAVLQFIDYSQAGAPAGVVLTAQAIADGTGLTPRTVQRVTARLRDRGYLAAERASTWDATLSWRVLMSAGQPEDANVAVTRPPDCVVSQSANVAVTPSVSEGSRELPPLAPQGEQGVLLLSAVPDLPDSDPVEAEFAEWWALYPRKDDRKPALRAYRTARRSASAETLLDGLRAHLPAYSAMRQDPERRRFVPLGASWLSKERWLNTPPDMPQARRSSNPFVSMAAGGVG